MTYSEPRSICTFFQISAFLRLIRLSFSPTLPSALHYYLPALFFAFRVHLVAVAGFGTYLIASGCTYGIGTVFSTPSACRSLSMPFRFDTRTGLRPGCCTSSVISTNAFAYLPGLLAARPSAFVEGEGLEPTLILLLHARCTFYGSLPSKSYPEIVFS